MVFLDEHIQHSYQTERDVISVPINLSLEEMERVVIAATLEKCNYNRPQAARELGIGSRTLMRKLKKFGIAKTPHMPIDPVELDEASSTESQVAAIAAAPAVRKQRPQISAASLTMALPGQVAATA